MPLQIRNKLLIFQFQADGIYDYYDMILTQVLLYNYQLSPQLKFLQEVQQLITLTGIDDTTDRADETIVLT
jgi:hypothetical protein